MIPEAAGLALAANVSNNLYIVQTERRQYSLPEYKAAQADQGFTILENGWWLVVFINSTNQSLAYVHVERRNAIPLTIPFPVGRLVGVAAKTVADTAVGIWLTGDGVAKDTEQEPIGALGMALWLEKDDRVTIVNGTGTTFPSDTMRLLFLNTRHLPQYQWYIASAYPGV